MKKTKIENLLNLLAKKRALQRRIATCLDQKETSQTSTFHKIRVAIDARRAAVEACRLPSTQASSG